MLPSKVHPNRLSQNVSTHCHSTCCSSRYLSPSISSYLVEYTPVVAGKYYPVVTIDGAEISTDMGGGVTVMPANASAVWSTFESDLVRMHFFLRVWTTAVAAPVYLSFPVRINIHAVGEHFFRFFRCELFCLSRWWNNVSMPETHCRDGTSTARNLEYATDGRVLPTGSNSKKGTTTLPNEPSVTPNLTSNLETYIETQVAFQGVAHTHTLEIRDRFGNLLDGYPTEDGFSATLVGTPDARAGILSTTEQNADSSVTLSTTVSNVTDASGKLLATFTPEVAGTYVMSNEYTGPGGLLATFFRTHDFTDAVLENSAYTTEVSVQFMHSK